MRKSPSKRETRIVLSMTECTKLEPPRPHAWEFERQELPYGYDAGDRKRDRCGVRTGLDTDGEASVVDNFLCLEGTGGISALGQAASPDSP